MSLVRDPADTGLFRRFWAIYREKRARQPVLEYEAGGNALVRRYRRMPRRAAAEIAWHQAKNASDCGCG